MSLVHLTSIAHIDMLIGRENTKIIMSNNVLKGKGPRVAESLMPEV
jgi:hypothetical protein